MRTSKNRKLGSSLDGLGFVEIADYQVGPRLGKTLGDRTPNARRSACYNGRAAFQGNQVSQRGVGVIGVGHGMSPLGFVIE
ncbi:hypothetical protein D3C71_2097500 [compost metagenome]